MKAEIGIKTSQGRLLGNYDNLRRVWVEADRLGFHSDWLFDHLFELPRFGPSHEPCLNPISAGKAVAAGYPKGVFELFIWKTQD